MATSPPAAPPLVRLEAIRKTYGPIVANDDISLEFRAGRITALLGENGAGKSTLMSILAGRTQPDSGRIVIDGTVPNRFTAAAALRAGIGMVYQHFQLVDAMTVAENLLLGRKDWFWLGRRQVHDTVRALGDRFKLQVDPGAPVGTLSMGEKQRVEILKLLQRDCRVLIFDEPTAVLTPQESLQLFEALRAMAREGKAVVFITHKLSEVMAVADDIAILRRGAVVDTLPAAAVDSEAALARRMVGRDVLLDVRREPMEPRQEILRVDGVSDDVLRDIHLTLRQGEVLGIVGVAGNGQKRLVEVVCGLQEPESGTVTLLGKSWRSFFARPRWDAALSYIPEDRQGLATCRDLDMVDNFLLTTRGGFAVGPWLLRREPEQKMRELVDTFAIRAESTSMTAGRLSGGNLQKMVLAREFFRRPRVIVAEQPTQGLDIGAMEDVWTILLKARQQAGILLVTGDLKEAFALSDRIAVMFDGRIMDVFPSTDMEKRELIGLLMAGVPPEDAGSG